MSLRRPCPLSAPAAGSLHGGAVLAPAGGVPPALLPRATSRATAEVGALAIFNGDPSSARDKGPHFDVVLTFRAVDGLSEPYVDTSEENKERYLLAARVDKVHGRDDRVYLGDQIKTAIEKSEHVSGSIFEKARIQVKHSYSCTEQKYLWSVVSCLTKKNPTDEELKSVDLRKIAVTIFSFIDTVDDGNARPVLPLDWNTDEHFKDLKGSPMISGGRVDFKIHGEEFEYRFADYKAKSDGGEKSLTLRAYRVSKMGS